MARPPLPRYVVPVTVYIVLGAEDLEHAGERAEAIAEHTAPRIKATVRATRIGAAAVDTITLGAAVELPATEETPAP